MIEEKTTIVPLRFNYMFKSIFADYMDVSFLTAILASFLNVPYEELEGKVTLLNADIAKDNKYHHGMTVDVIVQLKNGDYINIEMNCYSEGPERNLAYLCNIYGRQFKIGDRYEYPKKCIQINLNAYGKQRKIIEHYEMREDEGYGLTETLQIYNIDLVKCSDPCYNVVNEIEKWGKVIMLEKIDLLEEELKEMEMPQEIKEKLQRRIKELNEDDTIIGLYNEEERHRYGREMEKIRAEKEGLKKGLEQGKKEGFEQGKKEGKQEGIAEERYRLAKKLKENQIEFTIIAKTTNLSIEEIEKL